MSKLEKHFVTFYSPGTFVAETTEKPMECNGWDKVVQSVKGWGWTQPLEKGDVVL